MDEQARTLLRPLRPPLAFVLFALPATILTICLYLLAPSLIVAGVSPYVSIQIAFLIPFLLLFVASLAAYSMEGRKWEWRSFADRYRIHSLSGSDWLVAIGAFLVILAGYLGLNSITSSLVNNGVIPLPDALPQVLDPRENPSLEDIVGGSMKGRWDLFLLSAVAFFFNIAGEELWWRGYILPRQEVAHGRLAWVVHGLLWTLFHAFKYWEVLALLPACLGISWLAQRRKNTVIAIVMHGLLNVLEVIGVFFLVLGFELK